MVIPRLGEDYPRVTHPSATLLASPKRNFRVRLACVKHAASVRSEPGSNSQVKSVYTNLHQIIAQSQTRKNYSITIELLRAQSLHLACLLFFFAIRFSKINPARLNQYFSSGTPLRFTAKLSSSSARRSANPTHHPRLCQQLFHRKKSF